MGIVGMKMVRAAFLECVCRNGLSDLARGNNDDAPGRRAQRMGRGVVDTRWTVIMRHQLSTAWKVPWHDLWVGSAIAVVLVST